MNLNFSDLVKTIDKENNHRNLANIFIKELEKGLEKMNNNENIEYTIDRIEENIAVCENRQTNEMINIKVEELPKEVREGSILTYKDGKFILNAEKEEEIEKRIKEKMNNLWNN